MATKGPLIVDLSILVIPYLLLGAYTHLVVLHTIEIHYYSSAYTPNSSRANGEVLQQDLSLPMPKLSAPDPEFVHSERPYTTASY